MAIFLLHTRRPYGLVQANVQDLTPVNFLSNSIFDDGLAGWQAYPGISGHSDPSVDPTLFRSTTADTFLSGSGSIVTSRNVRTANDPEDLWFMNSTGAVVDYDSPIDINFRYRFTRQDADADQITIHYIAYLWFPSFVGSGTFQSNWLPWEPQKNAWNRLVGNIPSGQTIVPEVAYLPGFQGRNRELWRNEASSSVANGWHTASTQLSPINSIADRYNTNVPEGARLYVMVMYPEVRNNVTGEVFTGAASGNAQTFIDNLNIRAAINDDQNTPYIYS